jgi:beta-catenin-like protein 1
MIRENQERFRKAEGMELMVRCLKERKFAALSAVKVINFAISGNLANCERLIEAGGLKYLFPHLMGRNLLKLEKKKEQKKAKRELTEAAVSIISQLCHVVSQSKDAIFATRLFAKLAETEYEKLQRCSELFLQYWEVLQGAERDIVESSLRRDINRDRGNDDDDDYDDMDTSEARYAKRLDGGLFCLQQLSSIIAFACVSDPVCAGRAQATLAASEMGLADVQSILREAAAAVRVSALGEGQGEGEGQGQESKEDEEEVALRRTRQRYVEWGAALGAIMSRASASTSAPDSASASSSSASA